MKVFNFMIVMIIFVNINCKTKIYSDSNGINTKGMVVSKRGIYGSDSIRKMNSTKFPYKEKLFLQVIKTDEGNYNWLTLINNTDSMIRFRCEDGQPKMLQEAKDRKGNWRAIEYWWYSTCGNSYGYCSLDSNEYTNYKIHKYAGEFLTDIRVKMKIGSNNLYSSEFLGTINEEQFIKSDKIKNEQINW